MVDGGWAIMNVDGQWWVEDDGRWWVNSGDATLGDDVGKPVLNPTRLGGLGLQTKAQPDPLLRVGRAGPSRTDPQERVNVSEGSGLS